MPGCPPEPNPLLRCKRSLKRVRWRFRRARVALKYGRETLRQAPVVFGNAMPKSGSHLLTQVLEGLTAFGPFVNPGYPPVNRTEGNTPLPKDAIIAQVEDMKPGDIRYGYLHAEEPFLSIFNQPDRATIFIYRDPRDMLVSHVFYATEMHTGHGMHAYYTQVLTSMEERLNAAIAGVTATGCTLPGVRQRYDVYLGWLDHPGILPIKFEDLILHRDAALGRVLDYLENRGFRPIVGRAEAIVEMKNAIAPRRSGTFRKGQPGNWKEYFTERNKALFKEVAGDLLVRLGYEEDEHW